jgi:hypothetical protein
VVPHHEEAAHTLCAAAIEETEALQLQQEQVPNHKIQSKK